MALVVTDLACALRAKASIHPRVNPWNSAKRLKEINLRVETGATVIAVKRAEKIYHNPSADFILKAGDIILLIGKRENINRALEYLESDKFLDVL